MGFLVRTFQTPARPTAPTTRAARRSLGLVLGGGGGGGGEGGAVRLAGGGVPITNAGPRRAEPRGPSGWAVD